MYLRNRRCCERCMWIQKQEEFWNKQVYRERNVNERTVVEFRFQLGSTRALLDIIFLQFNLDRRWFQLFFAAFWFPRTNYFRLQNFTLMNEQPLNALMQSETAWNVLIVETQIVFKTEIWAQKNYWCNF